MPKPTPRLVLLFCALLALGLALFRWAGERPEKPHENTARPASEAADDVRTLRLGLNLAAGSALHAAAMKFAEQVEERSHGRLKISVFPDQQLGSDDQMLEMARNGTLDLLLIPTAKLSAAIPAMQYPDLPFYFSGREELYAMLDGEPGRLLLEKLNAIDLIGLTFWENGFKQFTANTPIRGPQDFARLRIRTMKSPLIAEQFSSLGAKPIPIDFHATYKALADGAVDGQENPLVAIVGMRLHEVQKHLTLSNHAYLAYVFAASKTVVGTLSPDLRQIIQQTASELTLWERQETARREVDFIEQIKAAGVEIHTLTPEERQRFSDALSPIADKFGFAIGYDLLCKTDELRFAQQAAGRGGSDKEPLIVGLDADLSAGGAQAGGAIYRGMQLAVDDINRKGGLLGHPLRIVALDHRSNPQLGIKNIEQLATIPSLIAVVGGLHSSVIVEELADIHRLKIPFLIPWAAASVLTAHDYKPSYTFRVSIEDSVTAPFLLERALKIGNRVAVMLERSAWGRSNEEALRPLIEKLPAGTVEIVWVDAANSGNEAKVDAIVRNGASVIVMALNPLEGQVVVRAMAREDKPIPILAHWGLTGGDFFGTMQASMQGALQKVDLRFVQSVLPDENPNQPALRRLLKNYRERYALAADDPMPSPAGTLHAYDLVQLLGQAVLRARSTDRSAIRDALETLPNYSGIMRDYDPPFTKARHDALDINQLRLARFDARGRIVSAD